MDKQIHKEVMGMRVRLFIDEYKGILDNDTLKEVCPYKLLESMLEEFYADSYQEGFLVCKEEIEDILDNTVCSMFK